MYKLFLHPTEKKSPPLLEDYLVFHKRIAKEFNSEVPLVSTDLSNPDLLVKKEGFITHALEGQLHATGLDWTPFEDHCAFEFKFGMDLVSSLNSGLLKDELTRMKNKYMDKWDDGTTYTGAPESTSKTTYFPKITLYLVIVNEWYWMKILDKDQILREIWRPKIPHTDIMWAVGIALDLNIRPIYCDHSGLFADKVFKLIRTPPKPVDLGQRFVIKSSGSEFNRSLQCYNGVTKEVANCIEKRWHNWQYFMGAPKDDLECCFVTESGRFMKTNMEKFLRKVSGRDLGEMSGK